MLDPIISYITIIGVPCWVNLWLPTDHSGRLCTKSSTPWAISSPQGPGDEPWPSSLQGVNHKKHIAHLHPAPQRLQGGVSIPSLPLQPLLPQGVHALLWKSNHSNPPPPPLSLFCKWPLPHHFTYTLQPLSSGDRPGSNCGFCARSHPPTNPFFLKGAAPPCQLSSYNCLQTQGPNDRIYSTWKHNYSPWLNCYCVNGL